MSCFWWTASSPFFLWNYQMKKKYHPSTCGVDPFISFGILTHFFWDEPVYQKQLISSVLKLMPNPVGNFVNGYLEVKDCRHVQSIVCRTTVVAHFAKVLVWREGGWQKSAKFANIFYGQSLRSDHVLALCVCILIHNLETEKDYMQTNYMLLLESVHRGCWR